MKTMPTFDIENGTGFDMVAGVDEAGRGPPGGVRCAGPWLRRQLFFHGAILTFLL